jgi:hypothetical protein
LRVVNQPGNRYHNGVVREDGNLTMFWVLSGCQCWEVKKVSGLAATR